MFLYGTEISVAHKVTMKRHGECYLCSEHLYPGEAVAAADVAPTERICLQCVEEEDIVLLT